MKEKCKKSHKENQQRQKRALGDRSEKIYSERMRAR